jgi:hypothetical protein
MEMMAVENSSGHGSAAVVPPEINRWNWGAFLLNWIWGIGNKTYVALLMFIPLVNFAMMFVLGLKGSAWAWRNRRWASVQQFQAVQRSWTRWSLILWAAAAGLGFGSFLIATAALKGSDAFKLAIARLDASDEVAGVVGRPISAGTPRGNVSVTGATGHAELSFPVEGPKGKGTLFVNALKNTDQWQLLDVTFEEAGTGRRLRLAR